MPHQIRCAVLFAALVVGRAFADDAQALVVTIKWDASGVSIDKVEKTKAAVPMQRGFPQLWSRFFELRDAQDSVQYAGPLVEPRGMQAGENGAAPSWTWRVVVPDLPDARRMVIVERVKADSVDKTRHVVKDQTLSPEN